MQSGRIWPRKHPAPVRLLRLSGVVSLLAEEVAKWSHLFSYFVAALALVPVIARSPFRRLPRLRSCKVALRKPLILCLRLAAGQLQSISDAAGLYLWKTYLDYLACILSLGPSQLFEAHKQVLLQAHFVRESGDAGSE